MLFLKLGQKAFKTIILDIKNLLKKKEHLKRFVLGSEKCMMIDQTLI